MRKYLAEGIGTFWLTFGGCGSAVIAAAFPNVGIGLLGVALAFGLTVLTMPMRSAIHRRELHVRQRADRYKAMGAPKSAAGEHIVPLTAMVANTLKEWKQYTGLHALRHFYASWCINRRVDGGLELPPR